MHNMLSILVLTRTFEVSYGSSYILRLPFHYTINVWLSYMFSDSVSMFWSVQILLFISVLSFRDIQLSEGYEWDSINNLIASQFHACPNTGPGFPMSYVVVFCVQLFEVRGGCSFC